MDLGEHLAQGLRIAGVVLTVLAGTSLVLLLGSVYLSKSRLLRHLALFKVQATQQGYTARTYPVTLIGQQGRAQTPLRPAGKVTIQGTRYDAKSPGTYVAPGTAVVVTDVAGTSLVVQAVALA